LAASAETPESIRAFRLPCRPGDDDFEKKTKAVIRRYVVERSIYGVDIDPLAVELCRLSLWIETMDRTLPFSFLDHKIKCGNSLVGAWFDQFRHYPVMAWKNREGGDKNHTNGVHFAKGARTNAIKAFVKEKLVPDTRRFLEKYSLFPEGLLEEAGVAHEEALAILFHLHDLPAYESTERARIYRDEFLGSAAYRSLKSAMDVWCACWFWPPDELDKAPLPTTLASPKPETLAVAERVSAKNRFFHWELEFPDVFRVAGSGFDALLGNPPWDIAKPNSKEFFSNIDPLYRSYGKQEALRYQTDNYFKDIENERSWLDYNAAFRAQSNFIGNVYNSFGDSPDKERPQDRFVIVRGKENDEFHARWRATRTKSKGYSDPDHPFHHQGSADINLYKLFLEKAHVLLRDGGRIGFIIPAGFCSQDGTQTLRKLFLNMYSWEWFFGFENRDRIFEIGTSEKFGPFIAQRGDTTKAIRVAFMRTDLSDWERAELVGQQYTIAMVNRFSPGTLGLLEITENAEIVILEKIFQSSVLIGNDSCDEWGIRYSSEFHMTNASKLFPPRSLWEAQGYRSDEYSRWLKGGWRPLAELWEELGVTPGKNEDKSNSYAPYDSLPIPRMDIPAGVILSNDGHWINEDNIEDSALPMYQGRMVWQFNHSYKIFNKKWVPNLQGVLVQGEYLLPRNKNIARADLRGIRLGFRAVQNARLERTFVTTLLPGFPAGNRVGLLFSSSDWSTCLLVGIMNGFVIDRVMKRKMAQADLNWFLVRELPLPKMFSPAIAYKFIQNVLRLCAPYRMFAPLLIRFRRLAPKNETPVLYPANSNLERTRIRAMIDAVLFAQYGLSFEEARLLLSDVDYPVEYLSNSYNTRTLDPKGFWRTGSSLDPELRHSVLSLIALNDLEETIRECSGDRERGIEMFLNQNMGEGWQLPQKVRLSDYGLGRDERARNYQNVVIKLEGSFSGTSAKQSAEEYWKECNLHARNLLGEKEFLRFMAKTGEEEIWVDPDSSREKKSSQRV
jgi:hypothetical protein